MDKLLIPKKIVVGCQYRDDTYSGKLAYIIYRDNDGKLRQEKSWRGWIHDKPYQCDFDYQTRKYLTTKEGIEPVEYDNVPTDGFVLNKKAGDYSSGWNHRQAKCRIWDKRGFEFEISIENLLYILQETNSFKGKGLEGEFVYAWDNKKIVLLPAFGVDYQNSLEFTDLKSLKITKKELIIGATYYTKNQENIIYLGEYNYIRFGYENFISINKEHVFYSEKAQIMRDDNQKHRATNLITFEVDKIAKMLDSTPVNKVPKIY